MLGLLGAAHVAIALGERVHGRIDHEAWHGQGRRETRVGEDDRVVALDHRAKDVPELRLGGGEIVVAAPEPSRLARAALHEQEGGRVVDHDEIRIEAEPARVLRTDVAKPAHHGVGDDLLGAREGATHRARDPFEVAGADRHLPARVDSQVVEDGDEAVQHLGGHAPVARAAHVDEAAALEALTQTEEEIHGTPGRHLAVVVEPGRGHGRRHRDPSSRAAVRTVRWRSRIRSRLPL